MILFVKGKILSIIPQTLIMSLGYGIICNNMKRKKVYLVSTWGK